MIRSALILTLVLGCVLAPGCASQVCTAIMPTISGLQADAQDAEITVNQAEDLLLSLPLSAVDRAEIMIAINKMREVLRGSLALLSDASGACQKPDAATIFSEVVAAWTTIAALLAKHAPLGNAQHVALLAVKTPRVVLYSRKAN